MAINNGNTNIEDVLIYPNIMISLLLCVLPDKGRLTLSTFVFLFPRVEFDMPVPASFVPESPTAYGTFEWQLVTVNLCYMQQRYMYTLTNNIFPHITYFLTNFTLNI